MGAASGGQERDQWHLLMTLINKEGRKLLFKSVEYKSVLWEVSMDL